MKRAVNKTAGRSVNGVMEFVDVDGIVRRIDVNDVMQRIDWDAVLDGIDIERVVLERMDLNRLLDRVDINKVLSRVDVNALVRRSDLGPIITASGTGVFTHLLDQIRIQVALIDQAVHAVMQGRGWRKKRWYDRLPPAPGRTGLNTSVAFPKGTSNKAVALQGRVAGGVSQLLAWWLDNFLVALIFSVGLKAIDFIWQELVVTRLRGTASFRLSEDLEENVGWLYALLFWLWFVSYHFAFVALTGRTLGQAVFGLLVGCADGKSVKPIQAAVRAPLVLVSIASVAGLLIGLYREDRRALHDLVAGTATVYTWDAKAAGLRDAELTSMERIQPVFESEESAVTNEGQDSDDKAARDLLVSWSAYSDKKE